MHRGRQQSFQILDSQKRFSRIQIQGTHFHLQMLWKHVITIFHQIQEDEVARQAEDVVCGNPKEGEQDRAYYNLLIKDDYNKINGLLQNLNVAVGAVYIVSCNLSTVDGLIDGAVCTMKHIDYRNSKNTNIPSTLWVQFEDEHIGQLHCQEYKHYYGSRISNTWTPIFT